MKREIFTISFILSLSFFCCGQSVNQTYKLKQRDVKAIFQAALDLPELQQYYHIETDPTRAQLIIRDLKNVNHIDLAGLVKFGKPVLVLTEEEIKRRKIKSYFVLGDWVSGINSLRMQLV